MKHADFLIEIQTEELPPKSLLTLAEAFEKNVDDHLKKSGLAYEGITRYVTPRRLALLIHALAEKQPDQVVEKRGPAVTAAFKEDGTPTPACLGFAKSCGLSPEALGRIKTAEGEWVGVQVTVPGQAVEKLMPSLLAEAVAALPVGKRMRWGDHSTEFSRPVRGVIMLYGDDIIEGQLLGCTAGRTTVGHRFHAPQTLSIPTASAYADILAKEGKVIADPILRAEKIASQVKALLKPNEKICADAERQKWEIYKEDNRHNQLDKQIAYYQKNPPPRLKLPLTRIPFVRHVDTLIVPDIFFEKASL